MRRELREARKVRAIARAEAIKGKHFPLKLSELPNMVDAAFFGDHEPCSDVRGSAASPGWVIMSVNATGREIVNALFPDVKIPWTAGARIHPSIKPPGWFGFKINIPGVVGATETNLPLDIMPKGMLIEDASPDQLSFLLAMGVKRAGGRVAQFIEENGDPHCEVYLPDAGASVLQ
jgi:hypothetical protein